MLASTSQFAQCCHSCGGASQERGFGSSQTTVCSGKRSIMRSPCHPSTIFSIQSSGAEPGSYSHLAEASVLRGLVNLVQAKCQPPPHPSITAKSSPLLSTIISLLASDIGRPLPPLDWSFLDSLHDSATLRSEIYTIVSDCLNLQYFLKQTCCY